MYFPLFSQRTLSLLSDLMPGLRGLARIGAMRWSTEELSVKNGCSGYPRPPTLTIINVDGFIVNRTMVYCLPSRGSSEFNFYKYNTHIQRKSFIINVIKSPYWGKSVQRHGVFQTGIFLDWFQLLARFAFTDKGMYQLLSAASDWLGRIWRYSTNSQFFYSFWLKAWSILGILPQVTSSLHIQ